MPFELARQEYHREDKGQPELWLKLDGIKPKHGGTCFPLSLVLLLLDW